MSSDQRQQLSSFWHGPLSWDVPMGRYCTFRAGGPAEALLMASSVPDLSRLIGWLTEQSVPWRVIGRGSNILVGSRGFAGALIILEGEFRRIRREDAYTIRVGAGCPVGKLVGWCVRNGMAGVEFLAGIPGSVGGTVRMNAGAWGGEIGSLVEAVTFVDRTGMAVQMPGSELEFSYRRMRPRRPDLEDAVVVEVVLALRPGRPREILDRCRDLLVRRRAKQPKGQPSAGSFFKNPPGDSAGRLIDAAGLKGLQMGGAMVSPKHANFIVNTGAATADDIIGLMREVQARVYHFSGVRLEPEVHLL
jgi:UDP-N-acetylmuramate dehydrogenase